MKQIDGKIFWEAGDLVRLKCGGPAMVVTFAKGDGAEIQTAWHNVNRDMQFIQIAAEAVVGVGLRGEVVPRGIDENAFSRVNKPLTESLDQLKAQTAEHLKRENGDIE